MLKMAKRLVLGDFVSPITTKDDGRRDYFTVKDFMDTYPQFVTYKKAENLSQRTLDDYDRCHKYMCNYIEEWYSDTLVRYDINLIRSYISWMLERVSPNTVNIRIRYLKVYLKFLEEEGYVKDSINHRVKKVKEVKNEKKPLGKHPMWESLAFPIDYINRPSEADSYETTDYRLWH
jgi:integrase/recombinase XerD